MWAFTGIFFIPTVLSPDSLPPCVQWALTRCYRFASTTVDLGDLPLYSCSSIHSGCHMNACWGTPVLYPLEAPKPKTNSWKTLGAVTSEKPSISEQFSHIVREPLSLYFWQFSIQLLVRDHLMKVGLPLLGWKF